MKKKLITGVLLIITGIVIGWILFHHPGKKSIVSDKSLEKTSDTIWTCSMDPQIRMSKPGKCPICGMDLIPLKQNNHADNDQESIHLSNQYARLAGVTTIKAQKSEAEKDIRLYGKVQADERMLQSQVSYIAGRIEKLAVNFTGESVKKGQILAEIYSPELINAQQELLETFKSRQSQPLLFEAAKEKLINLKLTDDQIDSIIAGGKVINNFRIISTTSGTVVSRMVKSGDYVSQGTVLFEIADLTNLWLVFDAYESDIQFLKKGDNVTYTIQSYPGKSFEGKISFIDPVIDKDTRVSKIRIEVDGNNGELKPEMFASGIAHSRLSGYINKIVIPKSAVLWTGKHSIVYVRQPETEGYIFKRRDVELGPEVGNNYVIMNGLSDGEEIAVNGTFSIDAASQLEGKPSMMNNSDK